MTDTIIEGTARNVTDTALTVAQPQQGLAVHVDTSSDPLRYLGLMPKERFEEEMQVIRAGTDRIGAIYKNLMRPDVDYGIIPGTKNPTLLQPGAERLAMIARLIPRHDQRTSITAVAGHADRIDVHTTTYLHFESLEGPVKGTGVASCSSYEDRYRWRNSERLCPKCGKPAIYKSKPEWAPKAGHQPLPGYEQGGWKCGTKKGGCGANFPDKEPSLAEGGVGKVENDEPYALLNTITQISAKRAFVAAVRHTLGITDLFTQDIEDMPGMGGEDPGPSEAAGSAPASPPPAQAPAASRQPRPASAAPAGSGELQFTGPVMATPDGIRSTRDGRVVAFAIKVGGSKHNVELWDAAADAAFPVLTEGTVLTVTGVRVEEDWPGRGDRAMKKVIKDISRIVTTDGELVYEPGPRPAPAPVQQGAFEEEPPLFDDDLVAAPVRTLLTGDPSGSADIFGTLAVARWDTTAKGVRFMYLEVEPGPDRYVKVAMKEEDARLSFVGDDDQPLIMLGTRVRVVGGWNGSGEILVSGMVMQA